MAKVDEKINKPEDLKVQAILLAEVVRRILKKRAEIDLSNKPIFQIKPVTEFRKRIRASALGKFEGTTYIGSVNYYIDQESMENAKAVGAVIVYIGEEYIAKLLQKLNYPISDEDNQEAMEDACGTFCNLIAGNFKSGLTQLGFVELVMSPYSTYLNEIVNGIPYSTYETQLYEISFEIGGKKRIVAELTMGALPRLFNPS